MRTIKVTGTGLVHTSHVGVKGITLIPGSAAATIVVNDSLDGTGVDSGGVKTTSTASNNSPMYGQKFATGIYATLTGAGAVGYIYIE